MCSADTPTDLVEISRHSTCELIARLSTKGLSLNVTKTEAIVLDYQHGWILAEDQGSVTVCVSDIEIIPKDTLKFLGIILNNKLS